MTEPAPTFDEEYVEARRVLLDALEALGVQRKAVIVAGAMRIGAIDPTDKRSFVVSVAGLAALLVAKGHKLNDRLEDGRQSRLEDKDAADMVRLMQSSAPDAIAATLTELSRNPISGAATLKAIDIFENLFGNRAGAGIEMAVRALRLAMPEAQVRTICVSYASELIRTVNG